MQIRDLGEDVFIQSLQKQFAVDGPNVGIGDDCAVIPAGRGVAWLVTADALVEGVHFLKDQISPNDLGYKTIAVNVSDIAAMGGVPKYAFLSIAFPKTVDCDWACRVVQGVKDACEKWNISLLGGDTVGSKRDIFINLTLIGSARRTCIKYRHQAKAGDVICVTGCLGDSGGGLKALQEGSAKDGDASHLIHAHFHPEPHLEEGAWLASHREIHAMMDVSDGLDCDLKRLVRSSNCGASIETSRVPISDPLVKVSLKNQWDVLKLALTGGEDYCLLLTISGKGAASVKSFSREVWTTPI